MHQDHMEFMQAEVIHWLPEEACGLLAGEHSEVKKILPIQNEMHSPTRFRMVAQELLNAFNWMEANQLELVAIYHSHPTGPGEPSLTDVAEAYYPDIVSLIWSPAAYKWHCKAFLIDNRQVVEIPINIHLK